MSTALRPATPSLSDLADAARLRWTSSDDARRAAFGQFFTPSAVGRFMASMFTPCREVRLLDPGAGVGSLTAAYVETALTWRCPPEHVRDPWQHARDAVLPSTQPLRAGSSAFPETKEFPPPCRRACSSSPTRASSGSSRWAPSARSPSETT